MRLKKCIKTNNIRLKKCVDTNNIRSKKCKQPHIIRSKKCNFASKEDNIFYYNSLKNLTDYGSFGYPNFA